MFAAILGSKHAFACLEQVNAANLLLVATRIAPIFQAFAGHSKQMQHCLIEVQVLVSMRTADRGEFWPVQPSTLFLQVII